MTVCDTSSDRLQLWLKNQFSLRDCDKDNNELEKKTDDTNNTIDKLMKDILKFGDKPTEKKENSESIKNGIMSMLTNLSKKDDDNNVEKMDINSQQSRALQLIEQRKKVEQLFENQEASQENNLESMIKTAMQSKMNQKVVRLANEILKEKKEASERIAEEKKEILSSINKRMEKEKQLVAAMALEESKMED